MTTEDALASLAGIFPIRAEFQGVHFRYAERNGSVIIEIKRSGRFFYWLLAEGRFRLVHASMESKFVRMNTVGQAFTFTGEFQEE